MKYVLTFCQCQLFIRNANKRIHRLIIYPLVPWSTARLPSSILNGLGTRYALSFPTPPQSPTLLEHRRQPKRRAEYAQLRSNSDEITDKLRGSHYSRTDIQLAMYRFALETCLGLTCANPGDGALPFTVADDCLLLDLGCGDPVDECLPITNLISSYTPLKVGVDIFGGKSYSSRIECVSFDLTRRVLPCADSKHQPHLIPFRDHLFDYIVSISFLQWLVAKDRSDSRNPETGCRMNWFAKELTRLLSRSGQEKANQKCCGKCVIQFYPSSWIDVEYVCNSIVQTSPNIRGCRILARPVPNRGVKLFLYFTISDSE
ncbi:unnamed protein product [Echinostoma caproni]|uniref:Methyltransf_11 domain-containing protein n=1 Tax=Echinostoma caproni TaxID=27848 RepID=A0A183A6I6_9TREM|nr:unnamed protein product [Echinostoma caproni]